MTKSTYTNQGVTLNVEISHDGDAWYNAPWKVRIICLPAQSWRVDSTYFMFHSVAVWYAKWKCRRIAKDRMRRARPHPTERYVYEAWTLSPEED